MADITVFGKASSAIIRNLSSTAAAISRRGPQAAYSQKDALNYFGPGVEVAPIASPDVPARGWQYWPFINQNFMPRPDAEYSAPQLRSLATYPLARMCIENSKDVLVHMPRQIRAVKQQGETNADIDKRSRGDSSLKMLNDFFDCPDGEHMWDEWLRPFLEDMFTIDAASWLVERTRGGKPAVLRYMDGAFVNCQIDDRGIVRSYQVLWSGTPAQVGGIPFRDLSKDELIYAPRNIVPRNSVASYLYGMSPTEQGAPEIQIGSARLGFILSYYTDGQIPDGIHIVPPGVSPDQLLATQKALEANLTGLANLYKRHHILLHQGYVDRTQPGGTTGDQLLFPKAALIADPEQETHLRKIAFLYGTPSNRLLKQLNRSTAQVDQTAAEEEGYMPFAMWLKNRIDWIIARIFGFGFNRYELTYDTPREIDPAKRAVADASDVKEGILSRDEVRIARGVDPKGGDASELMVDTAMGPVKVEMDDRLADDVKRKQAMPEPEPGDGNEPPKKKANKRKHEIPQINPDKWTPALHGAKARLETACQRVFGKQRQAAAHRTSELLKAEKDEKQIADSIYKAIEQEFQDLPTDTRVALEAAVIAGTNDAILAIGFNDAVRITSLNYKAAEYASVRAADLIKGISETTRDRLREIITKAFEEKTPFDTLISRIQDADIFSDSRAEMIARTEVANAQVQGNFDVWKSSGVVNGVKWLAVGPDPCPVCEGNDGAVRKLGEEFPSGDIMPTAHPNCYCILEAVL